MPARRHRSDEDVAIGGIGLHPDAIAEQRAAGDRARWIDGDDRDRPAGPPNLRDEGRDERGLARSRRPGDPDQVRSTGHRIEPAKRRLGDVGPVLDRGQQARQRPAVPIERGIGQLDRPGRGIGHLAARGRAFARR